MLQPWTWGSTHKTVLFVSLIFLITTLLLSYKEREQLYYMERKNDYCTENQIMEFENNPPTQSSTLTLRVLYIFILIFALIGVGVQILGRYFSFFKHLAFTRIDYITYNSIYTFIIFFTITLLALLSQTQYPTPNYARITDKLKKIFENTCYITPPYFTNLDPDLKRSIINKYAAYKEEQNKGSFYTLYDIEEELKQRLNQESPAEFVEALKNHLNFPYDINLINKAYKAWQNSTACGDSTCIATNPTLCTEDMTIPTIVPYSTTVPSNVPLILNWILIAILLYYFIHPLYPENKMYIVATIIVAILIILFVYLLGERNNV